VERVADVRVVVHRAEQPRDVRLVLREHPGRRLAAKFVGVKEEPPERDVVALDLVRARDEPHARLDLAPLVLAAPRPRVAVKQLRQHVQHEFFRPAVRDRQPDQ
jgi:hypothetical protein